MAVSKIVGCENGIAHGEYACAAAMRPSLAGASLHSVATLYGALYR